MHDQGQGKDNGQTAVRRTPVERRQRTELVGVRLLPAEDAALRTLARQRGHASVQALIRDALEPLLAITTTAVETS